MRAAYVYIVTPKKECAIDTSVAFTSKRLLYDYYGKEYYIKETHPFFIDEHDYIYELITKEEFEEYCQA